MKIKGDLKERFSSFHLLYAIKFDRISFEIGRRIKVRKKIKKIWNGQAKTSSIVSVRQRAHLF